MTKCIILDPPAVERLLMRYHGLGKQLSHDETELLLFALYCESEQRGGIVKSTKEKEDCLTTGRPKP